MVPEVDVERVRRWAAVRVPVVLQDQALMKVEVDSLSITVVERTCDSNGNWTNSSV